MELLLVRTNLQALLEYRKKQLKHNKQNVKKDSL